MTPACVIVLVVFRREVYRDIVSHLSRLTWKSHYSINGLSNAKHCVIYFKSYSLLRIYGTDMIYTLEKNDLNE